MPTVVAIAPIMNSSIALRSGLCSTRYPLRYPIMKSPVNADATANIFAMGWSKANIGTMEKAPLSDTQ